MPDKLKKLHGLLVKKGLDSKSFDEFSENFSGSPEKQKKLHSILVKKGIDNKDFETFQSNFFPQKKSPSGSVSEDGSSSQQPAPAAEPTYSLTVTDAFASQSTPVGVAEKDPAVLEQNRQEAKEGRVKSENEVALYDVRKRGDYQSDAIERMERGMTDYEKESLSRRTPLEAVLYDTDVTSKEYKAQVGALTKDQKSLSMALDALDEEIGQEAFDKYQQETEEYKSLIEDYKAAKESNRRFSEEDRLQELSRSIREFEENPLVQERNQMIGTMNKNLERFRAMEKDGKYAGVMSMVKDQQEIQKLADEGGTSNVNAIIVNSLAKMGAGIARMTDTVEKSIGTDQEYGALDVVQDFFIDLSTDAQMMWPTPSQYSRQLVTSTAKWGEYEVDFDRDEIAAVRKDGKVVDMDLTAEQEEEIKSLERSQQWNLEAAPYQIASTTADMAVMLAGAGKIKNGLTAIGVGNNAAAKTGVALSTAGQMSNDLYKKGLEIFEGNEQKAAQFSLAGGLSIGIASNLFNLEARLLGATDDVAKMNIPAATGKMTPQQAAGVYVKEMLKQGVGEGIEESIIENSLLSLTSYAVGGKSDMPGSEEMISEGVLGFAVGALFGGGSVDMNQVKYSALLAASENPKLFGQELRKAIESGTIEGDEKFVSEQVSRATRIGAELDKLDADIKQGKRIEAVALMDEKMKIEQRLDEVKGNEGLEAKYQAQLDEINTSMESLFDLPEVKEDSEKGPAAAEGGKSSGQTAGDLTSEITEDVVIENSPVRETLTNLENRTVEDDIATAFSEGVRLSTESYDMAGDKNMRQGNTVALRYLSKNGEKIDQWAQELAEKHGIDEQEAQQRIIDFINDNPKGLQEYADRRATEEARLETRATEMAEEVVTSLTEEEADIMESFLEQYETDGEIDMDRLEADVEEAETGFNPEMMDLPIKVYQKIKEYVEGKQQTSPDTAQEAVQEPVQETPFGEVEQSQEEESRVREEQQKAIDSINKVMLSGGTIISPEDERGLIDAAKTVIRAGASDLKSFAKAIGKSVLEAPKRLFNNAKKEHDAESNDVNVRDSINFFDSMIHFVADRDRYVKTAISKLKKAGARITSDMDAYLQKELMNSKVSAKVRSVYEDILGARFGEPGAMKKGRESMVGRMEEKGISWDMFNDLLYALHAKERNARVKELTEKRKSSEMSELEEKMMNEAKKEAPNKSLLTRWQNKYVELSNSDPVIEDGSGMSNEEADKIIEKAKEEEVWEDFLKFEKEFREKVITRRVDELFESGLINAEQRQALLDGTREGFDSKFEHYVPLYVKEEFLDSDTMTTTEGFLSSKIYGLRGSAKDKSQRHRPADAAMVLLAQSIRSAEQNKVANSLAKLVESNPLDGQWSVVSSNAVVKMSPIGEVITVDDKTPSSIKDNSVQFKKDGKTKYIFVAPTKVDGRVVTNPIITAFKSNPSMMNPFWDSVVQVGRMYNTMMRTLITSIDPTFGIANSMRDIQEALANATISREENSLKGVRRMIIKNYPSALRAIAKSPWSEPTSKMSQYWMEMKEAGVPMTWRNADNHESEIEGLMEYIEKTKPSAKGFGRMVYERMTFINDTLENVTRLSVYSALREKGVDRDTAAGAAKNVTVNFEKKGQAGNVINAFYLFASPGIQGAYNTAKLASTASGRKILGGVMLGSMMMRYMLYMLMDDEDIEQYVFNDFKSSMYVYVPNPFDEKNPITIPKPYSLVRVFQTLGEGMVDMHMGNKTALGVTTDFAIDALSVMDPFGGSNKSFAAFVPSVLQVPAELSLNRNWMGNKVYHFEDDPSKPDIFEANTSTIGEEVPLPGVDLEYTDLAESLYPMMDISPTTLEYVSKSYLTGIIKTLYNMEATYAAMEENKDVDTRKVPLMSRFYQDVSDNQRQTLFNVYNMMDKSELSENEMEYLKRNLPKVKQFMSKSSFSKLEGRVKRKFFNDSEAQFNKFKKDFEKKKKKAERLKVFK